MKILIKMGLAFYLVLVGCKGANNATGKNIGCKQENQSSKTALALTQESKAPSTKPPSLSFATPLGGVLEFNRIVTCSNRPNIKLPFDKGVAKSAVTTKFTKDETGKYRVQIFSSTAILNEIFQQGEDIKLRIFQNGDVQNGFSDPISLEFDGLAARKALFAKQGAHSNEEFFHLCSYLLFQNNLLDFKLTFSDEEKVDKSKKYCIDTEVDFYEADAAPSPKECVWNMYSSAFSLDIPLDQEAVKSGFVDSLVAQSKTQDETNLDIKNPENQMAIKSKEFINELEILTKKEQTDNQLYVAQLISEAKECDPKEPTEFCAPIKREYMEILRDVYFKGENKALISNVLESNFSQEAYDKLVEANDVSFENMKKSARKVLTIVDEIRNIYKANPSKLALLNAHVPNVPNPKPSDVVFAALPLTSDPSNAYVGMEKFVLQGNTLLLVSDLVRPGRQNLTKTFQTTNIITFAGVPIAALNNGIVTSGGASVMELPKRVQRTEDTSSQKNKDTVDSTKDPKKNKTGDDGC